MDKTAHPKNLKEALQKELRDYLNKVAGVQEGEVIPVSNELFNLLIQLHKAKTPDTILDRAKELVYGDRAKAYGHPSENFANIADLWSAYIAIKLRQINTSLRPDAINLLNTVDVACLNILQKIARLAVNPSHEDSIIDIAGYSATIERIVKRI